MDIHVPAIELISLPGENTIIEIEVDGVHVAMVKMPHFLHLRFIRHIYFLNAVQRFKAIRVLCLHLTTALFIPRVVKFSLRVVTS